MKILFLDIETAPNVSYTWGLWEQNISLDQLVSPSYMLCFAAKWLGVKKVEFSSIYKDGRDQMLNDAYQLMTEADVICHYNGERFDIPVLNKEFVVRGIRPPAPSKQLDLYKVVKKQFAFPSHKLAYVSKALGLEGKAEHAGMDTWTGCMNGDPASWKVMEKYNKQDVVVLEEVYDKILPWITTHPNVQLYSDIIGCPTCGGTNLIKEGFEYTQSGKFQRYSCKDCGRWSKSGKRIEGVDLRGAG